MSDVGSNSLLSAFVELRAKAAANFESEARDSLLPGLGRIAQDAAGVFAATKVFDIGREGIDRLGEMQKTLVQTGVVLRSTGGAAGVSAAGVEELASSLSKMSGVDHEAIQGAENLILQMGGIKNAAGEGKDIFDRTTKAALDLSVAMGTDVSSAASTLSLVLEDPVAGMARLRRAHIVLSDSQKRSITDFAAVGDVASAQAVILDQVEKQVGGSAKAYGETLPGQLAKAQTAMKDAKAAFTAGLAPALEAGSGIVTDLAEKFSGLPKPVQEAAGAVTLLGTGIVSLLGPAADAARLITTMRAAHVAAATAATAQAAAETGVAVAEGEVAVNSAATVTGLYATASGAGAAAAGFTAMATTALTAAAPVAGLVAGAVAVQKTGEELGGRWARQGELIKNSALKVGDGFAHLSNQIKAAASAVGALSEVDPFGNIIPGTDGATKAMLALQAAAAAASASVAQVQASAATGLLASTGAIEAAQNRVADARDKVRTAGERLNGGVQREQEALAAAVEAASSRIVTAEQSVVDAQQKVADAQEKLAHAGAHEGLAVNDAQDAVDAAQRKLNASTPEERGPAQHALDDAKQKLVDAKEALDRAKPDAERALDAAVRGVVDAERAASDAHRQLADAQQKLTDGSHLTEQAQRDYDTAVRGVNDALLGQAQAVETQRQLQEELATGIKTGPVEALGLLKQSLKDISDQLDPSSPLTQRLLYLLASLTGTAPEVTFGSAGGGSTPGRVARRASGGSVFGGQVFEGAEQGAELLLTPGRYQAPAGGGVVIPAAQTAQLLHRDSGAVHNHYNNVTVVAQAEPAERAVRRELDRLTVLAGR